MTIRENEIAARRRIFRKQKPSQAEAPRARDGVMTIKQFAALNCISYPTAKRIIARGELPVLQLSPRRVGIRESDCAAWQASRVR